MGSVPTFSRTDRMELYKEKEAQEIIQKKFASLFVAMESIWVDALSLMTVGSRIGAEISEDRRLCLIAVYTKIVRLAYATERLCRLGLGLEAQLQVRTMFENYLHLKYLDHSDDIDACASQYIFWDMANDEGLDDMILEKHPELKPKIDEDKKKLLKFKADLGEKNWRNFVRFGPSKLSILDLCKHIDTLEKSDTQSRIYKTLYHETSGQAHGFDFLEYAQRLGPNDIEAQLVPSEKKIKAVLATAIILLSDTCRIVNNRLNLGKDKVTARMGKTVQDVVLPLLNL